jgi:hypothetical protein
MKFLKFANTLLLGISVLFSTALNANMAEIDIPFDKFTLDNGLTVIVHEDRKAPIVAISIWYHVGSKDEPAGRCNRHERHHLV